MKNEIAITYIKTYSQEVLEAFNKLLPQLSLDIPTCTEEFLRKVLEHSNVWVFVARNTIDKEIIGMVTLVMLQVMSGKRATLEDLVVDKDYRGQGIGRQLLEATLDFARKENMSYIDLTSRPSRIEANELYTSLGFKKRDTNVYRYIINNSKGKS